MASYNRTRYVEDLLERTKAKPPSFTVHLHMEYWTLNNGSKFLYNNQIASLLDDVRAHRIPVDFLELFEAGKVPFYDGCIIVELLDYRPQRNKEPSPEKPERTRVVLHPNAETVWADICSLNQKNGTKWTDMETLEMEAQILLATTPPLCLEPDPHLTRVANHILRVSTPTVPVSLKRKASAMDAEEDESEKARRAKIMSFLNPRQTRTVTPNYRILDLMQSWRAKQAANASTGPLLPQPPTANGYATNPSAAAATRASASPQKPATPSVTVSHADSPIDVDDQKKTEHTPQLPYAAPTFSQRTASQTPAPAPTTHQFINTNIPQSNPSPAPTAQSPLQPLVYPNVQAATEASKRASTPAQRQSYAPSSRPGTAAPVQQPTPQPHPIPAAAIQQALVNGQFLTVPPRPGATPVPKAQVISTANSTQSNPQVTNAQINRQQQQQQQQQLLFMQQFQQQQQYLQHMQNSQKTGAAGRSTPLAAAKAVGSVNPGAAAVTSAAAHASPTPARATPLVNNQTLAARSPMPTANQLPGQQPGQQQGQPTQHAQQQQGLAAQMAFAARYNPALVRGVIPGNLPPQLAGIAAVGQQAQQAQAAAVTQAALAAMGNPQQNNADGNQTQTQTQQQQLQQFYHQQMMYQISPGMYQQQLQAANQFWNQSMQAAAMGRGMPPNVAQAAAYTQAQAQAQAHGAGNVASKAQNQGR